jgi:hypothetical protein
MGEKISRTKFGFPGALIIVVSQLFSSFKSSENISKEIEGFRAEFQQSLVDREIYFVRKTELVGIDSKIDRLNEKILRIGEQIRTIKTDKYYSLVGSRVSILGCFSQPFKVGV